MILIKGLIDREGDRDDFQLRQTESLNQPKMEEGELTLSLERKSLEEKLARTEAEIKDLSESNKKLLQQLKDQTEKTHSVEAEVLSQKHERARLNDIIRLKDHEIKTMKSRVDEAVQKVKGIRELKVKGILFS